jgi:hypothetical protein
VSAAETWWRAADRASLARIQASYHALCLRRLGTGGYDMPS